jgi:hypothetical protein
MSRSTIITPLIKPWAQRIEKKHFSKLPILVGGCARSGTTLLLGLLAAHPRIFAFPRELGFLTDWTRDPRSGIPEPTRIHRFYRELILKRVPASAHRWCEKSPANVRHIDQILSYYGEGVRFIHIVRDPRDVCISEHPRPDKKGRYHVSPQRWVQDVKAGLSFEDHPSVLTLRYEDLLRHYDEKMDRICRFIGEERVPEMDDWSAHTSVRDNPAWKEGASPLSQASIGKWHDADPDRLREILEYPGLKELMERCGYSGDR